MMHGARDSTHESRNLLSAFGMAALQHRRRLARLRRINGLSEIALGVFLSRSRHSRLSRSARFETQGWTCKSAAVCALATLSKRS